MTRSTVRRNVVRVLACLIGLTATTSTRAAEVHAPPTVEELRAGMDVWLRQRGLAASPVVDAISPQWQFPAAPTADELFGALMRSFYLADDNVRKLVDQCRTSATSTGFWKLDFPSAPVPAEPLLTNNLKYFVARHLATLTAYNEAAELFESIDVDYVADPAGALFHKAVCEHHLLRKEAGLATLDALLNHTEKVPERYRKLGELMKQDLDAVRPKSLGEVARQMKDVERRLTLNRADEGVQDVERKIVATLDELIKKMEDEQKKRQQSASGGSSGGAPERPADDSYLHGVSGEGLVDKKDQGHKDNWGDLPPKAKEAAKNMLENEFPAHYRQAVEEYLKKLAERPAP